MEDALEPNSDFTQPGYTRRHRVPPPLAGPPFAPRRATEPHRVHPRRGREGAERDRAGAKEIEEIGQVSAR